MLTKFLNQNGTQASQQAYDALGTRVWTQVPGGPSVHYVYDGDTIIGEVVKTSTGSYIGAVYTWGADGRVSSRLTPNGNPKSLWYHYGPQGAEEPRGVLSPRPPPAASIAGYSRQDTRIVPPASR